MRARVWVATAAAMMFGGAADAALTTLTVSGTITNVSALLNSNPTTVPSGMIHTGDAYTLSATFDSDRAVVSPTFDVDPSINIYDLPGTLVTINIGSYRNTFVPRFDFNSEVQIWNNRVVTTDPVDAQSFNFFNYQPTTALPFEVGAGSRSESITFNEFDYTAAARSNDLLPLTPTSGYGTKLFSYGLLNADTNLFVYLGGNVTSAAVTSAVPEPASWVMMLAGFGAIGTALRQRRPRVVFG